MAAPERAVDDAQGRRDASQPSVPVGQRRYHPCRSIMAGRMSSSSSVEPGPHELTLDNNRAALVINGVRDRLKVLLVSGEPHPGERTWRNILKSDPSVDLVHFTILRPPEKQDGTPIRELSLIAFPIRELFDVKLDEFDLIIFDRYQRRGVLPASHLENVVRMSEKGGALLEARPEFRHAAQPLPHAAGSGPAGRADRPGHRAWLQAAGHRDRRAPSGDRRPARRLARRQGRPEMGPLVPQCRGGAQTRRHGDERRRRPAAARARPRRQGPRRAAPFRSDVAMDARLRGRRPAGRAAAPPRLLADAGAGSRGERPARHGRRQSPDHHQALARAG